MWPANLTFEFNSDFERKILKFKRVDFLHTSKPEQCSSMFPRFVLTLVYEQNKLQLGPLQLPTLTYIKQPIAFRDISIVVLSGTWHRFFPDISGQLLICCSSQSIMISLIILLQHQDQIQQSQQ